MDALLRLRDLLHRLPDQLYALDESEFSSKPSPEKWSKKEILGHLVDSAANNLQRFIRAQYEKNPSISYDQNKWNELNHYQDLDSGHVIKLWTINNTHLLEVMKRIPQDNLVLEYGTGGDQKVSLQFLIGDYVQHLEHHLKQIFPL